MRLNDRVALVTGGGRAIGKAIALRLADDEAAVVVAGPDGTELEGVAEEVRSRGKKALAVVADVTQEKQIDEMVERAEQAFGAIDVLVNNAGVIGPTAPVQQVRREEWDEVLAVNLTGAFLCCKAVLPGMIGAVPGRLSTSVRLRASRHTPCGAPTQFPSGG